MERIPKRLCFIAYFNVGKIGDDQVHELAKRRGVKVQALERLLAPNL